MFCSKCGVHIADDARFCASCGASVAPSVQPAAGSTNIPSASRKRPGWVWVIFCFYLFSAGFTLLSFFLIFTGRIGVSEAQRVYFANLSALDFLITVGMSVLALVAATSLFFLRRVAVSLFAITLACNVGYTMIHAATTNVVRASGVSAITGMVIAWVILVAIVLYARRLAAKGILS